MSRRFLAIKKISSIQVWYYSSFRFVEIFFFYFYRYSIRKKSKHARTERAKRFNSNDRLHRNPFSCQLYFFLLIPCTNRLFTPIIPLSLFFLSTYYFIFPIEKKTIEKRCDWYKAIVYSISHLLVFAQKNIDNNVHLDQQTNERMKRRKWCTLDGILRFMKRVLIHTSNHGEKWGSGGYHLKKKKRNQYQNHIKKGEKRRRKKKKREWNTEANVSSESPMNFPAVKRTAFWLLIISIFVIFCRLYEYPYQGIEYVARLISILWKKKNGKCVEKKSILYA